jgi:hypothetical protein
MKRNMYVNVVLAECRITWRVGRIHQKNTHRHDLPITAKQSTANKQETWNALLYGYATDAVHCGYKRCIKV